MSTPQQTAKRALSKIAATIPTRLLQRIHDRPVCLPYYHIVTDDPAPHVENLYSFRTKEQFAADVDFFADHFTPIRLEELHSYVTEGKPLPDNAILLTFDDGFREIYDTVAPTLKKRNMSAVFFLNTATLDNKELCFHQKTSLLLDQLKKSPNRVNQTQASALLQGHFPDDSSLESKLRAINWNQRHLLDELAPLFSVDYTSFLETHRPYLTSSQVDELLAQGFEIGAHSHDHPRYADIPLDEQLHQTRTSVQELKQRFQTSLNTFAFPQTDRAVTLDFFNILKTEGSLNLSFGTAAPNKDTVPFNLQRFTMEKTSESTKTVFARIALRSAWKKLRSVGTIERLRDAAEPK